MTDRDDVRRLASCILLLASCTLVRALPLEAQEDPTWRVAPTPQVEIGEVDGEDVYLFQSVRSADFLPDGRIVVADGGGQVIRIYSPDGEFRTEFGGRGEGPGEFRDLEKTWVTSRGRIAVWDEGNRRITTFDRQGELKDTELVAVGRTRPRGLGNLEAFLGVFSDGDVLLGSLALGSPAGGNDLVPDRLFVSRFGLDGKLREVVGELSGMRRHGGRPIPFSPVPLVAVARDTIFEADGYGTRITVRDETGSEIRTIDLPRREVSADGVWSSLEAELRRRRSRLPIYKLFLRNLERGRVPRDARFPQLADLLVDDRGHLWVKRYEPPDDSIWLREKGAQWPAPGGVWQVVRPDGRLEGTVRMPEDVRPLEINGDRLLGLATEELGVERVVVHRIRRRPSP